MDLEGIVIGQATGIIAELMQDPKNKKKFGPKIEKLRDACIAIVGLPKKPKVIKAMRKATK